MPLFGGLLKIEKLVADSTIAHSGKLVLYNLNFSAKSLAITDAKHRVVGSSFISHAAHHKKIFRHFELLLWLIYSPMRQTILSIG